MFLVKTTTYRLFYSNYRKCNFVEVKQPFFVDEILKII